MLLSGAVSQGRVPAAGRTCVLEADAVQALGAQPAKHQAVEGLRRPNGCY
jgi:hypothetical protein